MRKPVSRDLRPGLTQTELSGTVARSLLFVCLVCKQSRDGPLCPARPFVEMVSLFRRFKKSKLSVTGKRMGTKYWLIASGRLAQEQCGLTVLL